MPGQPGWVGGGHHKPQPPIRTPAGQSGVGCPLGVGVAIAEAPLDASPLPGFLGTLPAELTGRLDRSMGRRRRRPDALARLEGQHEPDPGPRQGLGEARVVAIKAVGHHRLEPDTSLLGGQLDGELRLGPEPRIALALGQRRDADG